MIYRGLTPDYLKENIRNMLSGKTPPKASDALLQSDLFDSATNRFRLRPEKATTDYATARGSALLFINAIIPEDGSLAVPLSAEGVIAEDDNWFNPVHFGFDYATKTIKIPVYKWSLTFQFGTKQVTTYFPDDGIYSVGFTADWNSIITKTWLSELEGIYLYPKTPPPNPITLMMQTASQVMMLVPIATLALQIREAFRRR